jgi:hypothetical protein
MIEAQDLSKRYGDRLAVDNLSFTVKPEPITRVHRPERRRGGHRDAADPEPGPVDQRHGHRGRQPVAQHRWPTREIGAAGSEGVARRAERAS